MEGEIWSGGRKMQNRTDMQMGGNKMQISPNFVLLFYFYFYFEKSFKNPVDIKNKLQAK
jgi:hypothetical protein